MKISGWNMGRELVCKWKEVRCLGDGEKSVAGAPGRSFIPSAILQRDEPLSSEEAHRVCNCARCTPLKPP